jgi:hypothetical protein
MNEMRCETPKYFPNTAVVSFGYYMYYYLLLFNNNNSLFIFLMCVIETALLVYKLLTYILLLIIVSCNKRWINNGFFGYQNPGFFGFYCFSTILTRLQKRPIVYDLYQILINEPIVQKKIFYHNYNRDESNTIKYRNVQN